jgi:O-antigen ligase
VGDPVDSQPGVADRTATGTRASASPATASPATATRLIWALVIAIEGAALLVLIVFGNPTPSSLPQRWLQLGLIAAGGLAGWLLVLTRPAIPPTVAALLLAPTLAAGVSALANGHAAITAHATLAVASLAGLGVLLAFELASPIARPRLAAMALGITALVGIAYLATAAGLWADWLAAGMSPLTVPLRPANVGGLIQIPTWLADAVVLTTPIAVTLLWQSAHRQAGRAAAAGVAILGGLILVITGTRSIWLATGAVLALAVVLQPRWRRTWLVVATGLAGVAGIGLTLLQGRAFDEGRLSAYQSAVQRFLESPLVGTGPGTYALHRLGDPVEPFGHLAFPSAHNVVLNTAGELGLVGLLGLAVSGGLGARLVRRRWLSGHRRIVVAALIAISIAGFHALLDVVFEVPALAIFGLLAVGFLVVPEPTREAPADPPDSPDRASRRRTRLLAAVGLAVTLVAGLASLPTEAALATLTRLEAARPTTAGLAELDAAIGQAPDLAPLWVAKVRMADALGEREVAFAAARRLAELEPLAQHRVVVALLSPTEAERERWALSVTDQLDDPFVALNVLDLLDPADHRDVAVAAAVALLATEPWLELAGGRRPGAWPEVIGEAREVAVGRLLDAGRPADAAAVALASDDPDLLATTRDRLAELDPDGNAAHLIAAWTGDGASAAVLHERARSPDAEAMVLSWTLASRACDDAAEARWATVHRILTGGRIQRPVLVDVVPALDVALNPIRYPSAVWHISAPRPRHPAGVWLYGTAESLCAIPDLR